MTTYTEGTKITNTNTGNILTVESVTKRGDATLVQEDGSKHVYKAEQLEALLDRLLGVRLGSTFTSKTL